MMDYLRENKSFEKENINSFLKELEDLESSNPTIIAFGNDAYSVLVRNLKEQYNILKVPHYSDYTNKEKYREQVRSILKY
jgi:alcohol dehydrogenase YqhD (iron-dependent ADH family)